MMDSFVEAQNNLKRMSYAGCATLKTWQSHAVRFLFMPMVMKSPGLKPIEAQNARSSSACSLPGFYVPEVAGREFWLGAPDCSVVTNNTLAIERRGGRGGRGTPMLARSLARAAALSCL